MKLSKQVIRSNKTHLSLRKKAKTKQEAKYHLTCVMSQTNMDKLLTKKQKRTLWETNK